MRDASIANRRRKMDESSGVVLCLDFPAGLEFGIDTVSWQGTSEATCGSESHPVLTRDGH